MVSATMDHLWLANQPALDFVNTEVFLDGKRRDLLGSGDDLLAWLKKSGLLAAADLAAARQVIARGEKSALAAGRGYRAALRQGLGDFARSGRFPTPLLERTNALIAHAGKIESLVSAGGGYRWQTAWRIASPEDVVAPVADSFARLLASGGLDRLRKCQNPKCILWFHDTSKSATRHWCSDRCGGKVRVAKFRNQRT